ncbi:MAG TPA: hypothetical protein VII99_16570 [Bacteroidia bacterium]
MNTAPNQRTTFLTVLCILSFINGGMNILFNIPSLFTPNIMEPYVEMMKQMPQTDSNTPPFIASMMHEVIQMVERMSEHYSMIIFSTILLALMSVIGVWMMWHLKKAGFLFYCTAQILWTITPFIFFGTNTLITLAVVFSGFITLIFIILYGLQLKRMS